LLELSPEEDVEYELGVPVDLENNEVFVLSFEVFGEGDKTWVTFVNGTSASILFAPKEEHVGLTLSIRIVLEDKHERLPMT